MEYYHKECKGWECTKNEMEKIWRELEEKVKKSIKKVRQKIIPWKMGRTSWHNKKWKEKKRELRRELRRMKKKFSRENC